MVAESFVEVLLHNWPAVLAVAFSAYFLSNYFNRGLNKYPGPFLARLTDWLRFYKVYKRRPEVWHLDLHAKYGDVVRLGPNDLSFADPKALKTIYGLNKGFTKVSVEDQVLMKRPGAFWRYGQDADDEDSPNSILSKWLSQTDIVFPPYSAQPQNHSMRNYDEVSIVHSVCRI